MLPSTFWLDFLALEKSSTIIYKAKKILRIILRLDFLYLDFYSYCGFAEPFGKIGISIGIDVGIGIAKKLFCL